MPQSPAPRFIYLQPDAPAKPAEGGACNGCGVCCAAAPCPLGAVLSRRLRGPCAALDWVEETRQYRCGALAQPGRWLPFLPRRWAHRLVVRWIAAGRGCDSSLQVG